MALKAVKPEVVVTPKPKFLLSGRSGVGKTMFSLGFPAPYYMDVEGGAVRQQYRKKLVDVGGVYFGKDQGSDDFGAVLDEIKSLATTKHQYKTLIIDSFSHLYLRAASIAEEKIGNEFGRDKKEANRPTRQLMRWIGEVDMTVLLVCHSKEKWERRGRDIINTGSTFDGYDKLEFDMDLWLEAQKLGNVRSLIVRKSRIESFPEGKEFPLDYQEFATIYGKETIEKDSKPVEMATPELASKLRGLLDVVKVEPEVVAKWLEKAGADKFEDMKASHINACIALCEKKLFELTIKGGK
jgi:hypothetical protein